MTDVDLLLQAIVDAIKQDPRTKDFSPQILEDLAALAIKEDRLEDSQWLDEKITALQREQIEKTATIDVMERIKISKPQSIQSREDLNKVLIEHAQWMRDVLDPSVPFPEGRANLQGCNLAGWDLTGVNLSCADLRRTNFEGANLKDANLSKARLEQANLRACNLLGANLKQTKLDQTDLRDAILDS